MNVLLIAFQQQLYMAAGENEGEGSSMGSPVNGSLSLAEPVACAGSSSPLLCSDAIPREGQQSEQLCVVCHYFPLSRALLPCRHTCICAICFCEYKVVLRNPNGGDEKKSAANSSRRNGAERRLHNDHNKILFSLLVLHRKHWIHKAFIYDKTLFTFYRFL